MVRNQILTAPRRWAAPAAALAGAILVQTASAQTPGKVSDVTFDQTTPLSSNPEMARRLLSPLTSAQLSKRLAQAGKALADQPLDLGRERFALYVPAQAPAKGYGLLVFVPPWPEATLPPGWAEILDRHGIIYVSAARSGNDQSILGRREPLALMAATNVQRRYKLDPERIYIGGLSGGSRVALRLALAYPDLFRGALLNAGSDPIGGAEIPLPPRDLFEMFQARTRLVYLTGGQDEEHLGMDAGSRGALHDWCVFDVNTITPPGVGHEIASPRALAEALDALDARVAPDPAQLTACRAGLERTLGAELDRVKALLAEGRRDEAHRRLTRIDQRFGGLAAPASLDLSGR
jgi:pimeloyl-ACP methyl ester carboxylesterase